MRNKDEQLYKIILIEIIKNSEVTEKFLADKYLISERTIRRYIKDLKNIGKIKLLRKGKVREWKIL